MDEEEATKFDEGTERFTSSKTVNILPDPHLMHLQHEHH